jgi:hypothetical protein
MTTTNEMQAALEQIVALLGTGNCKINKCESCEYEKKEVIAIAKAALANPSVASPQEPTIGADARAYAHKCIERVAEMRKLDLERAKEPGAVDVDYYLGRAHRCDDILFWLGEYESHIEAGPVAAPVGEPGRTQVSVPMKEWLEAKRVTLDARQLWAVESFIVMNCLPVAAPPAQGAPGTREAELLAKGLADVTAGRVRSLEEIKDSQKYGYLLKDMDRAHGFLRGRRMPLNMDENEAMHRDLAIEFAEVRADEAKYIRSPEEAKARIAALAQPGAPTKEGA